MRVRDAMTRNPATCTPESTLRQVAQILSECDCAAIPVAHEGMLIGIITDRDISVRGVALRDDAPTMEARSCMSSPVIAVNPDDPIEIAVALMTENAIHHLPVIDERGMLVGMLAQSDIGRRMTNREFGQLARNTSIRMKFAYRRADSVARRDH